MRCFVVCTGLYDVLLFCINVCARIPFVRLEYDAFFLASFWNERALGFFSVLFCFWRVGGNFLQQLPAATLSCIFQRSLSMEFESCLIAQLIELID